MQMNRLLEIVYILLDKKTVTAGELAEHFEVSRRTIYRDLDALSSAGIPVYASKGKGGGIRLLESYVLNKSVLTEKEQKDILASLQGMKALNVPGLEPVLRKLNVIFHQSNEDWIEVDFSQWGGTAAISEKFSLLKTAILNKCIVEFAYFSSRGEQTARRVEPVKLLFKGQSWYLYGFCTVKQDYRYFRITRINQLVLIGDVFQREAPNAEQIRSYASKKNLIRLVLRIEREMAYRVYDEFESENILKNEDGSFHVSAAVSEDEWVYGYILSYGDAAEVLEPEHLREIIKGKLEQNLKKYL
jgi:predicted DNA-binding transcriptional regulator YafY